MTLNTRTAHTQSAMSFECLDNVNIENNDNVCTQVTNYFSAHERIILVFNSRVAKQQGK